MSYCPAILKPDTSISIEITLTVRDSPVKSVAAETSCSPMVQGDEIQIRVIASLVGSTSF